ncbi:tRNA (adenosine(37)-N6)-threonylcarbamoyltransferase complex ATPase subunit type 1 TsaE [Siphonobacter sp. SORGH_AS_0500]|uniref:tRNA (adenosine(37)-N6)-threonylcarbamoyltransferase complex ATPase subunit type 1 TsaE n=1 Tax=Siphonobacter sp. SORGH_AS_0500 TaxID=1864824 RepID=UPI000CB5369A|nr:tRNA (adenosine(37)-N6)-threonylcarbamoyltransferase complex ATPase subunit type 1 TsaE [Siphonobacter sp. SORGH_AS_0500]PKK35793.1 tRNA (adenosine(37)-N6)-threonylcarbamoyltransferase complex ATPase subunit type 1 TsaE [Siphonobacter sp. SORGH_AS_0500]
MQEKVFHCASLTDLPETVRQVLAYGQDLRVWLFEGEMGAGKTTFVKALCRELGVLQTVQSPTFALVNEYSTDQNDTIYHFDFYRIKSEIEAFDIGVEEYFYSGNFCFVEWPSQIPHLWPEAYLSVRIESNADDSRSISVTKVS